MGLGILGVSQYFYRAGGVQLRTQVVKHSPKSNPTPCKKISNHSQHKKNNYTLYKRSVVVKKNKIIVTKHQKMEECIGRDGVGINGRWCGGGDAVAGGGVWEPAVAVNGGLRSE